MEHPLRTYRKKAGISLEQLGLTVGVTKGFLSKIESGHQAPSLKLAVKISEATRGVVCPADLLAAGTTDSDECAAALSLSPPNPKAAS
jgi:DNA-binding XRE family transcriptional regulator